MNDEAAYAPLVLYSLQGKHYLNLSDVDMVPHMDVFDEVKREGNGYDWTAVAVSAIRETDPSLEKRVTFDPEAGSFTAIGDLDDLRRLAAVLHGALHDHARLRVLLRNAPADWM